MSNPVHIKMIESANAESLSSLKLIPDDKCYFSSEPEFSVIDISELASVEVEDTYENNQRVFTTTVTFHTCVKHAMQGRHLVFRLTDVKGKQYMVGANMRPYPIIKENNPYPSKPTESTLKQVTITWKSVLPMLEIV